MRELPSGTVTFLFTDVEGSTKLLHELGAEGYSEALAEHRRILREAFSVHGGVEVDTQGDAFFVAFATAPTALKAAAEARTRLTGGPIRVRMGIHTGTPHVAEEGYVGVDVHRAARIAAAGHGGQVLVSASTAALLDADGLRDLGEHRLKDLSAPERIYQLGADDFPPLKSLHQTNLPIPTTPFLGRERELGEVLGLLSQEAVRLLTLTGAGGSGKTRLGLQAVAALAERYPQGVWWVPLATLRDPALVLASAGQALGAKNGLAEHIGDKTLLLLFDNFEHLVEAAPELAGLLASCPNLDLLVTSREPLRVSGEQEYAVAPLVHEEGVRFFLARARAVRPEFGADEAVSEICRRLDDLPLALELAAARVKALSSAQILERLEQRLPLLTGGARDLPERQRTLRATIEWSYELLSPEEQRLFALLAVFRGGCTLEAAEDVAGADLDTLQSLVDKSLLRHSEERYWMLETIREYAAERLEASAEAPCRALPGGCRGGRASPVGASSRRRLAPEQRRMARPVGARGRQPSCGNRLVPGFGRGAARHAACRSGIGILVRQGPCSRRSPSARERAPERPAPDGGPRQGADRSGSHGTRQRRSCDRETAGRGGPRAVSHTGR
jgi:predicted ATPase